MKLDEQKYTTPIERIDFVRSKNAADVLNEVCSKIYIIQLSSIIKKSLFSYFHICKKTIITSIYELYYSINGWCEIFRAHFKHVNKYNLKPRNLLPNLAF